LENPGNIDLNNTEILKRNSAKPTGRMWDLVVLTSKFIRGEHSFHISFAKFFFGSSFFDGRAPNRSGVSENQGDAESSVASRHRLPRPNEPPLPRPAKNPKFVLDHFVFSLNIDP